MTDGHTWKLRVASQSSDRATIFVRGQEIEVGAPLHADPQYRRITALEYLLAGIGGDLVNGLRAALDRRRIPVAHVEALISGSLNNPLVFFGVIGEEGHPGLEQVTVRVFVSTVAPEEQVRAAWEEVLERSPAINTFRRAVALELQVQIAL